MSAHEDPNRTAAHQPAADPATPDTVDSTRAGTVTPITPAPPTPGGAPEIPGYAVTGEIARGGMGRVYAAHDLTLGREVAIKTLLPGANVERFVTESRITARLPHPGIPPVHAAGVLADGSPYLVMKQVRGRTLADLLRERTSPGDELSRFLQAFEQIAQAVGFAHSRGIIHRDLKPANVMVGEFGEVQVMDWGLAKEMRNAECGVRNEEEGTSPASIPHSEFRVPRCEETQAGTVMGTPGYMAPEQARGEVADARADVFALGSVLATILTGEPAFVGKAAKAVIARAAAADLADCFDRLDACGADAELVALARWCLAANADNRPADARRVAAEVAAYRAGVEARLRRAETERAEALVREGEQRKRRRVVQWAGGVIAGVLALGIIGTAIGMIRAKTAADKERTANEETKRQLATTVRWVELFAGLLTGINPWAEEKGGDPLYVQLRQRAEKAADELDAEAVGDPLAVARLRTILGDSLWHLGSYAKAEEVLEKARLTRERELGADHPDTLATLGNLALAYGAAGKLPEAIALHERVRDAIVRRLGADHPDTLATLNNLAAAYHTAGKLPEAIALFERVRDAEVRTLGAEHPSTLGTLNNLAESYRAAGKLPEAIALSERVRDAEVRTLGAEHPHTLSTLGNLGAAYCDAGQGEKAVLALKDFVAGRRKRYPPEHPRFAGLLVQVAGDVLSCGQYAAAEEMLREALTIREQTQPGVWTTFNTQSMLGGALLGQKKYAEAEPLLVKGYEGMKVREKTIPQDGGGELRIPVALDRLIDLYTALDKSDEVKRYVAERKKYPTVAPMPRLKP